MDNTTHISTASMWRMHGAYVDGQRFPTLSGTVSADVAIIGGGIAGVTAAWLLKRCGAKVVLIDAHRIGSGDTARSTAHLTDLLDTRYQTLEAGCGTDDARRIAQSSQHAIESIAAIVGDLAIDCDFQHVPASLYAETPQQSAELEREAECLYRLGMHIVWSDAPVFAPRALRTLQVSRQGQLDPLRYLSALTQIIARAGVTIFENTAMVDLREGHPCEVTTSHGTIQARDVLMMTHTALAQPIGLQLRLKAFRTYALAARVQTKLPPGLYFDMNEPYHYVRAHPSPNETLVIVGGADHKVGQCQDTTRCHATLETYARDHFGAVDVLQRWSGHIVETVDGLPFIGPRPGSRHVYVATGFSGTGITFATLAAEMLRDAVTGGYNDWSDLYAPDRRTNLAQAPQIAREGLDVPRFLVGDRLSRHARDLARVDLNEGRVMRINGNLIAAHRDRGGKLHLLHATCTHMGCIVHWNAAERSWDCPCHGSRFDIHGDVLQGPAMAALRQCDASALEATPNTAQQAWPRRL